MGTVRGRKPARTRLTGAGAGRLASRTSGSPRVVAVREGPSDRGARAQALHLLLIGAIAFAVRALYLLESRANPFRVHLSLDPKYYHEWAQTILNGRPFGPDVFAQAPLYPYVLAGFYALTGADPVAPLWLQALLGASTAVLGAILAARFFGRAGLWATGLLLALYKPAIFYTGVLLVPVVATLLLAAAALLAARRPFLAGVCAGLCALAHPVLLPGALLIAGGFAVIHSREERGPEGSAGPGGLAGSAGPGGPAGASGARSVARVLLRSRPLRRVLLGAALAILPATVHNLAVSGHFVPISANGGINFYIGNGAGANGFYTSPFGLRAEQDLLGVGEASYRAGRTLSIVASSRFWTAETMAQIRAHPLQALGLYLRKVYFTLSAYETPQVESLDFEKRFSTLLRVPLLPTWMFLVALAGFSLVVVRRSPAARLAAAAVLVTALLIAVFFATARFRFPLHFPLAWIGGGGIAAIVAAATRAREAGPATSACDRRRILLGAGAAAALVLLLAPNWLRVQKNLTSGQYHYRLGVIAEGENRAADARREYEEALAIDPAIGRAAVNLGILHARDGDLVRARPLLERGVRLDPRSSRGLLSLGQVHQMQQDLAAACSLYAAAWDADTTYLRALESLATAEYVRGEVVRAESLSAALLRRAGGDPLSVRCRFVLERIAERRRYGLAPWHSTARAEGDLALAVNDLAGAEGHYRSAVAADPRDAAALLELARIAAASRRTNEAAALAEQFRSAGGPAAAVARLLER